MKTRFHWMALCAGLATAPAWADHPLVSETADALPRGSCQVEFARATEHTQKQPMTGSSDVQFSCGAGARSQFAIGMNSARVQGRRVEQYRAAGKTTLLEPSNGQTGFGVRYGLTWATGLGLSTELESSTIMAVATREVRNGVLVHANLGFSRDRQRALSTGLWSLGVETTDALAFAADVYGEERGKPSLSLGMGWRAMKGMNISLAYAMQTGDEKFKTLSLGLKLVF